MALFTSLSQITKFSIRLNIPDEIISRCGLFGIGLPLLEIRYPGATCKNRMRNILGAYSYILRYIWKRLTNESRERY